MSTMSLLLLTTLTTALALAGCDRKRDYAGVDEEGHHSAQENHDGAGTHAQQTVIVPDIADQLGIRTSPVGPGVIRDTHEVHGLLTPIEGRHARVRARFPGPVKGVQVGVGDRVKAGETLAVIESNASLSPYSITAPFAGTVLDVNVGIGDLAGDEPLFELADLSALWVDVHLFGPDAQHIIAGLPVQVTRLSDDVQATAKLDRILPGTATASQSTVARATIPNSDGLWRPGTAVRARIAVSERKAALVVPLTALQKVNGATVVFTQSGDSYAARKVTIGERDTGNAEILDGLKAGETIVIEQSYLIKSDLEKASAAHED